MPRRSDLPSNGDDARVSKRLAMRWLETTGRRMANPAKTALPLPPIEGPWPAVMRA